MGIFLCFPAIDGKCIQRRPELQGQYARGADVIECSSGIELVGFNSSSESDDGTRLPNGFITDFTRRLSCGVISSSSQNPLDFVGVKDIESGHLALRLAT